MNGWNIWKSSCRFVGRATPGRNKCEYQGAVCSPADYTSLGGIVFPSSPWEYLPLIITRSTLLRVLQEKYRLGLNWYFKPLMDVSCFLIACWHGQWFDSTSKSLSAEWSRVSAVSVCVVWYISSCGIVVTSVFHGFLLNKLLFASNQLSSSVVPLNAYYGVWKAQLETIVLGEWQKGWVWQIYWQQYTLLVG